jgi:hypothetical protein
MINVGYEPFNIECWYPLYGVAVKADFFVLYLLKLQAKA